MGCTGRTWDQCHLDPETPAFKICHKYFHFDSASRDPSGSVVYVRVGERGIYWWTHCDVAMATGDILRCEDEHGGHLTKLATHRACRSFTNGVFPREATDDEQE